MIFISHSSKDDDLARAVVDLLSHALLIPGDQILCTSLDGHRLAGGANTQEVLRSEVNSARLLIGLITRTSWQSAYVLFELGARWGVMLPMIPLLAGISPTELSSPLKDLNALDCTNHSAMLQLVDDVGKVLERKPQAAASYNRYITALVNDAGRAKSIPPPAQGGGGESYPAFQRLRNLRNLLSQRPGGYVYEEQFLRSYREALEMLANEGYEIRRYMLQSNALGNIDQAELILKIDDLLSDFGVVTEKVSRAVQRRSHTPPR